MKEFNLDLIALKACMPAMSNDEARYYLCGVHIFEKEGVVFYEATNGHLVIRVESEQPNEDYECSGLDIILPDFIVKHLSRPAFLKPFGVEGDFIPCNVDGTRINIEMLSGVINVKLVDGTYPNVDAVIPKASQITFNKINVNGAYMDALAKSIKSYSGSSCLGLEFTGERYGSPILIKNDSHDKWVGALMPITMFDAE